jgi:hypothetical protein
MVMFNGHIKKLGKFYMKNICQLGACIYHQYIHNYHYYIYMENLMIINQLWMILNIVILHMNHKNRFKANIMLLNIFFHGNQY